MDTCGDGKKRGGEGGSMAVKRRQPHAYLDAVMEDREEGDEWPSDLEDFIDCDPNKDYAKLILGLRV